MKYSQHLDYGKRKRFLRSLVVLGVILTLCAFGWLGYVYRDNIIASNFNSEEQTVSTAETSYIAPSIKVFNTPYFQFQADKNWSEDAGSSNASMYVYRSMKNGLVEHQLTVYVNSPPEKKAITRVLPVTPNENNRLKVTTVSEHCGKAFNFTNSSRMMTLGGVSFNCFGDDTRYTVMVGLAGGTTDMVLARPDNSTAVYSIYYSNVTATPDAAQIEEIVRSFQTR